MSARALKDVFDVPDEVGTGYPQRAKAFSEDATLAFDAGRRGLPPRIRELVAVVTLAYLGNVTLGAHMRRALEAGASTRDIIEALFAVATPGGQICLANGLRALIPIVDELGEGDALKASAVSAKAKTAREVSPPNPWPWLDDNHAEYQAIRRELNDLTFMPASASLEPRYREILVAVVLGCRGYPTVPQHLRRAVVEGVPLSELFEAMNVASLIAGQVLLAQAHSVLEALHREIEAGTLKPA